MTGCVIVGLPDQPPVITERSHPHDLVPRGDLVRMAHRAQVAERAACHHRHPDADRALVVYREALERLATSCTRNITGQSGSCPHPQGGGPPIARERWCSPCIAADALATAEGLRSA